MGYVTLEAILDALESAVAGLWPDAKIYRNVTPKNFERPAFYLDMVKFTVRPENGTPCSVARYGKFRIVSIEEIDDYHNSQVFKLDTNLDRLAGLFAPGFFVVGDRALHTRIADDGGQIVGTDAAELTVEMSWLEDLADYAAGDPEDDAPQVEHIEIKQ